MWERDAVCDKIMMSILFTLREREREFLFQLFSGIGTIIVSTVVKTDNN